MNNQYSYYSCQYKCGSNYADHHLAKNENPKNVFLVPLTLNAVNNKFKISAVC